jgi:MFS family permease
VLPDYAARFNAGPTTIGLLFASFGVTLLAVSLPMGVISDRLGRKGR